MKSIKLFCFDLGDTIMIEETEVKDHTKTTLRAEIFPGMKEALVLLKEKGLKLALVADTRPGTYVNVLKQHGLFGLFDAFAISEELGTEKPDPRMFQTVLDQLNVSAEEAVMCGNNLARDIAGANALGMTTIWFHWNDRYPTSPPSELAVPDYTVRSAAEFLDLVKELLGEAEESVS
jgi:putative hydrolase of the HAD superfamily